MGCHTQFRGLRLNWPFGSAVAAALSIEYVISAQWRVAATVTPPTNPAHYTHESGGPAAAPLLEVSRSVPSSRGAVDAVRFSAARQFSPGARIAQAAEQGRK